MKIYPVSSFSFKSNAEIKNYDLQFLYTLPEKKEKNYLPTYAAITALSAVLAVFITLFNISGRHRLPYNIVEINDALKGLNKISDNEKLVESLKLDFIYPIKAFSLGDKKIRNSKKFKTGLIITGQEEKNLKNISDALIEHFGTLGINTVTIPTQSVKIKDGKTITRELKRNEITKKIFQAIKIAHQDFEKTGKLTVFDLGNLDKITELKIVKSQNSKFEELLSNLSSSENAGIIWIARTDKQKALPLFLNQLPILIKK